MVKAQQVFQTPSFKRRVKKLNAHQKHDLDNAIREIIINPLLGERKKGDLQFLLVYKFQMSKQLTLLGYSFNKKILTLELIALGHHENFYRDIKNNSINSLNEP